MNVTQLIEDLQEIADLDPTTVILVTVNGGRYRSVEGVAHVEESTLTRPVAAISCSMQFVVLES